ncbi:MAG: hypothetical protein FWC83_02555 [Alphaproteobacteria bacterium]|nr:hypothetical protein [Alphaproteobacteria bacterium]
MKRKIILLGTSTWVIPMFERVASEHEIVAVFTRAPKPAGRKKILTPSPVHQWADEKNIPVYTNINQIKSAISNQQSAIDYIVVASYGVILKDEVLAMAPTINIHPSDLPAYRGPSPMTTAIYNGNKESAVCLMEVVQEVDAGDVYMREPFIIGENDTNEIVEKHVAEIGADMLSKFLKTPANYPKNPQIGTPTFTRKWTGADEIIDWNKTPKQIHDQVRSIGGRTKINGIDCKILETKITNNELEILRLQPAGKKPMDFESFKNGYLKNAIQINFGI